jgi:hypothetical protein
MPDPKDNAKMTGDTHLPDDTESEFNTQEAEDAQAAAPQGAGDGERKDGELKDRDAETSNSYGKTRDSGDGSKPSGKS